MNRLIRYGTAGTLVACIQLCSYLFLVWINVWYLASSTIAFVVALVASFLLQKYWTFKERSTNRFFRQFLLHMCIAAGGLTLNAGVMYLLVEKVHMSDILAQVIVMGAVATVNFFAYKEVFKVESEHDSFL